MFLTAKCRIFIVKCRFMSDVEFKKIENRLFKKLYLLASDEAIPSSKNDFTFDLFFDNKLMVVKTIDKGLPYDSFLLIQKLLQFSTENWSSILQLSPRSIQRYASEKKDFGSLQTEKIIEMTEVTFKGIDTFGSIEKFKLWLETPNYALGKMKPFDLLKDSYGKDLVLSELHRIDHGILA